MAGGSHDPSVRTRRVLLVGAGPLADALAAEPSLADLEVVRAAGRADALQQLRARDIDVVVTDPSTSVHDDLAFVSEVRAVRRSARIVVLAPVTSQQDVIASIRAQVFALLSAPFEPCDLASVIAEAAAVDNWRHGIEVISGLPNWISLRVSSRRVTAERLVRFHVADAAAQFAVLVQADEGGTGDGERAREHLLDGRLVSDVRDDRRTCEFEEQFSISGAGHDSGLEKLPNAAAI